MSIKEHPEQPLSFYRKMAELQEKLRQLEEEREFLADKYTKMVKSRRKRNGEMISQLKEEYACFLEQDRQRKMRTQNIMASLENIEHHSAVIHAKTEHLKASRRQYNAYTSRLQPKINTVNEENAAPLNFSHYKPQWQSPFSSSSISSRNYISHTQADEKKQLKTTSDRYAELFGNSRSEIPPRNCLETQFEPMKEPNNEPKLEDFSWSRYEKNRPHTSSEQMVKETGSRFGNLDLNLDKILDLSEKRSWQEKDPVSFEYKSPRLEESEIPLPKEEKTEFVTVFEETEEEQKLTGSVEEVKASISNNAEFVLNSACNAEEVASDVADTVTQDATFTTLAADYAESVVSSDDRITTAQTANSADSKTNDNISQGQHENYKIEEVQPVYVENSRIDEERPYYEENYKKEEEAVYVKNYEKVEEQPHVIEESYERENNPLLEGNGPINYTEPELHVDSPPQMEEEQHIYVTEPVPEYQMEPQVAEQYGAMPYQAPFESEPQQVAYQPEIQGMQMYGGYQESSESSVPTSEVQYQQPMVYNNMAQQPAGFREMELEVQQAPYVQQPEVDYGHHEGTATLSQISSQPEDERISIQSVSQAGTVSDEVEHQMAEILKHAPTPNRPPAPPGKTGISPSSSWGKIKNLGNSGVLRTRPGSPSSSSSKSSTGSKRSSPNRSPSSNSATRSPSARRSNINK